MRPAATLARRPATAIRRRRLCRPGNDLRDGYGLGVRGIKTTPAMNCNNFDFASAWLDRLST